MKKKLKDRVKNIKAADAPRKAEKMYRPPGSRARTAGVFVFWTAFAFILLAFLANMLLGQSQEAEKVELPPENPAAGLEGVEFAKNFAETYFTWTASAEGWESQQTALAPMLGDGLDEKAGIIQKDQSWDSSVGDIHLVQVEETGERRALVTLSVEQKLSKGDENKTASHTFAVPVEFSGAYAIYELPSFTAVPAANAVKWEKLKGAAVDAETEQNMNNFLSTFFQSYAADPADKLAYFLETGEPAQGLEGSVNFVEVSEATIVKGSGEYNVSAYVVMQEPATGTKFTSVYRLSVVEQDGRYVVTKLNQGVE